MWKEGKGSRSVDKQEQLGELHGGRKKRNRSGERKCYSRRRRKRMQLRRCSVRRKATN